MSRIKDNTEKRTIKSNDKPCSHDKPRVQIGYQEIVPPDGGWGWVVCFAVFMESLIFDGIFFSFGVIFLDITDYFKANKGVGAFIPSLAFGMCFLSGIAVAPLCNRLGHRIVMLLGSVAVSFGLVLSSFATSIRFLYVSYGLVAGFGYGMVFLPSAVAITIYFKKKRSFATGLALCGNGLGVFIMIPVTEWLLQHYTWKGTFLIHAGLCLNGIACGLVYRPLTTNANITNRCDDTQQSNSVSNNNGLNENMQMGCDENSAKSHRNNTRQTCTTEFRISMIEINHEDVTNVDSKSSATINDYSNDSNLVTQTFLNRVLRSALKLTCAAAKHIQSCFVEIFDVSLLKDTKFSLFVVSSTLYQVSLYVPFIFLPDLYQHKGIDAFRSAWLVSSIGLTSIASRVFVGKIIDHPNANRLIVYGVTLIVSGLVYIMLTMFDSFETSMCLTIIYGLCYGITNMLITILIPDLVETHNIPKGIAVRLLFSGFAVLIGPPFAGWLFDVTQSYAVPFYVCGSVTALGGLLLFAIPMVDNMHRRT